MTPITDARRGYQWPFRKPACFESLDSIGHERRRRPHALPGSAALPSAHEFRGQSPLAPVSHRSTVDATRGVCVQERMPPSQYAADGQPPEGQLAGMLRHTQSTRKTIDQPRSSAQSVKFVTYAERGPIDPPACDVLPGPGLECF